MTRRLNYKPVEVLIFFCNPETKEVISEKMVMANRVKDIKEANFYEDFVKAKFKLSTS